MTTTTARSAGAPAASPGRLTFGGILRSEWIKFASLASSVWCLVAIVVATIGFGLLLALTLSTPGAFELPYAAIAAATAGTGITQLIVVVLGTLVVTREYGTGMIRSTFTAAPRRLSVLAAKALVFTATVFVVTFVTMFVSAAIAAAILGDDGPLELGDAETWRMLAGAAVFLSLVGLLGLALGTLVRNTAGGISSALGLLLVLPLVLQLFGMNLEWVRDAAAYLPLPAGQRIYAAPTAEQSLPPEAIAAMGPQLEPWQGLLVLLAWVVAVAVPAAILLRRRDA